MSTNSLIVRRPIDGVMQTTILYAGPLKAAYVHLPLGSFEVLAEVHEEAGAFATYIIKSAMDLILPDESAYEKFDVVKKIEEAQQQGDQNTANQLLIADVS